MRLRWQVFLGILIGSSICVWFTLTQPRTQANINRAPLVTPIPTLAIGPTPTPVKPVVVGKYLVTILFFGVTLEVTDPISNLVYGQLYDGYSTGAGFTTRRLLAKYPTCKAGVLGTLVRTKAARTPSASPTPSNTPTPSFFPYPTRTPYNQPFHKTIGEYTYSYRPSYSSCADDQAGLDELAAARAALKNASLPTLSNNP
jgi:hypothetical protein